MRQPAELHPITLQFLDPDSERSYLDSFRERAESYARWTFLVAIVIWMGFSFWDHWMLPPEVAAAGLRIRAFVGLPALVAEVLLTFLPAAIFRRIWEVTAAAALAWILLTMVVIQFLFGADVTAYLYIGLAMGIMFAQTVAMLRFVYSTAVALIGIAAFMIVVTMLAPIPIEDIINATTWLGTTTLFGMINSYRIESLRRRTWRQSKIIEREQALSERLLVNMLPPPIALRLKRGEEPIADSADQVTVLFADIVGFTTLAQRLSAPAVVEMLNDIFSDFDELAARHGLEKIKTIGDAYMAVAGVPLPRADHATAVLAFALDMQTCLTRGRPGSDALAMRIGIHSGPVVAGVIGRAKYSYDLWGDTVNTASRMESHGVPGRIQLSDATAALVADAFDLEERGTIDVKGKGAMRVWFVRGRRGGSGPA